MKQEKPILIYRIDEKKKSVIYLRCTNNKNLLESISAITLKEISFDELLRDAFDFNKEYPNTLTIAALKAGCTLGEGQTKMRAYFSEFMPNNNFFSFYYKDYFPEFFVSENRKVYKKTFKSLLKTTEIELQGQNEPSIITKRVCYLTNPKNFVEWDKNKFKTTKVSYERIIVHNKKYNDSFSIADDCLELFFYDFYYTLHKDGLHICKCKNCQKYFTGLIGVEYCKEKKCQNKAKAEYEKNRRRQPYNAQIAEVDSYIGDQRDRLKKATHKAPKMLAQFEAEAQKAHDGIRKKIKEYKEGGCDPQDAEMKSYIANLKYDLSTFVDNLIEEYKKEEHDTKL